MVVCRSATGAGEVAGQALLPGRQHDGVGARSVTSTRYAGRGAGGGNSALVVGSTRHGAAAGRSKISLREVEPGAAARRRATWWMPVAPPSASATQRRREVAGVGRAADLVVDDAAPRRARRPSRSIVSTKFLPPAPNSQEVRTIEVVAGWRAATATLAGELGAPVGRARAGASDST